MWHSDCEHNEEEIKVLKELEYDLFMLNPGFRKLWNDDFESYFKSLFNEDEWENQMDSKMVDLQSDISRKMIEDHEFANYMKEQAILDEVLNGDLRIENVPVEMRENLEKIVTKVESQTSPEDEIINEFFDFSDNNIKDPLYQKSKKWGIKLTKLLGPIYERTQNTDIFRIMVNCGMVAVQTETENEKVGFILALKSLRRCIESMQKLKNKKTIFKKTQFNKFLSDAADIQSKLIDRLDDLDQNNYKNKIT